MSYLGWLGSVLLLVSSATLKPGRRWPFLLTVAGEALWIAVGAHRREADVIVVCALFGASALRNYFRWAPAADPRLAAISRRLEEGWRWYPGFTKLPCARNRYLGPPTWHPRHGEHCEWVEVLPGRFVPDWIAEG